MNRAGIYFDVNDVVMTNEVTSSIGCLINNGLTPLAADKIEIYPNPAGNELNIRAAQSSFDHVTITSSIGNVLLTQHFSQPQSTINISALPAGLYFINLHGGNGKVVQKFLKL